MIRNAFSHAPFNPVWRIDADCREKSFEVRGCITLRTDGIDGSRFDWRHYGGPLAVLALAKFVRCVILRDESPVSNVVPLPSRALYQQGDIVLARVPAGESP